MSKFWVLLPLIGMAGVAQPASLSFDAALDRAEAESPRLAAQNAKVEAAKSSATSAAALPDPKGFIGIENLPVNGMDRWNMNVDSMTMKKIGLMQEVPNGSKRRARSEAADAAIQVAEAERQALRLKVRREAAQAWIRRYYLERKIALLDELEHQNQLLGEVVRAQIAGGRGSPADAIAPRQEAARLADRRDELMRDLAKAKAELRRYVSAEGDEPLAGDPPHFKIEPDLLRQHLHHHPELQLFEPAMRVAEAEERETEATRESDWSVALAYQKRAAPFSDMVSVEMTFDLPLFTGTRQEPQIAARRQQVAQLAAERDAMQRDHAGELENQIADYLLLSRELERANQTWIPLAREKAELRLAGYRAGRENISAVIDDRRDLVEQQLKAIDLESQLDEMAAALHFAYEENLP